MINSELFWHTVSSLSQGIGPTLYIGLSAILYSLVLGLALALVRVSNTVAAPLALAYSTFFRGTPLLIQLFIVYFGVGTLPTLKNVPLLWSLLNDRTSCAIFVISLNSAAYISEVFRGGFQSVPAGQMEAARAIGMSPWQQFKRVRFPLAIRQALPAYSNEVILVIKGTSLASTIPVLDITGQARRIMSQNYAIVETFVVAGLLYLIINFSLLGLIHLLERWLHIQRR